MNCNMLILNEPGDSSLSMCFINVFLSAGFAQLRVDRRAGGDWRLAQSGKKRLPRSVPSLAFKLTDNNVSVFRPSSGYFTRQWGRLPEVGLWARVAQSARRQTDVPQKKNRYITSQIFTMLHLSDVCWPELWLKVYEWQFWVIVLRAEVLFSVTRSIRTLKRT